MELAVFSIFQDPGYSANDTYDGSLTNRVSWVSNLTRTLLGTYTVAYTVVNAHGLSTTVYRTVKVVDRVAPVLLLLGQAFTVVEVGDTYTDAGATAQDNYDGDITSRIVVTGLDQTLTAVAALSPSLNTITYRVNDSSGNSNAAYRTVQIVDSQGECSFFKNFCFVLCVCVCVCD